MNFTMQSVATTETSLKAREPMDFSGGRVNRSWRYPDALGSDGDQHREGHLSVNLDTVEGFFEVVHECQYTVRCSQQLESIDHSKSPWSPVNATTTTNTLIQL